MAESGNQPQGARALPTKLPSLTGMRFIAALMVFLFHAINAHLFADPRAQGVFDRLFHQASSGVSFFFVLSGFVIMWSVRPGTTRAAFWRRRFVKIYPNHLVTFVVAFLLITYGAKMTIAPHAAALNLLLLHSWFPDLRIAYSVNVVSWSLSCEMLFYLLFPFLVGPIGRIRPERLWAWAAGVVALIVAIPAFAHAFLPDSPLVPETGIPVWQQWMADLLPPSRVLECVFGMLLARIVITGRRLPVNLAGALVLTVVAYAAAPLVPKVYGIAAVLVVPIGLVIATGARRDAAGTRSWLASRPMVWLGEVSFAFYLWHLLVMLVMRPTLSTGPGWGVPAALGVLVFFFALTLLLAWLLFAFVERPMMRRFAASRRGRPGSTGAAVAPPPVEPVTGATGGLRAGS